MSPLYPVKKRILFTNENPNGRTAPRMLKKPDHVPEKRKDRRNSIDAHSKYLFDRKMNNDLSFSYDTLHMSIEIVILAFVDELLKMTHVALYAAITQTRFVENAIHLTV